MNAKSIVIEKRHGYIQLTTLIMVAFASAFFSAVLTLVKFPSTVNLLHFILVPALCIFTLTKTRVKERKQILITKELIGALFLFFAVNIASAFVNNAGIINAVLNFLFLCEGFLLIAAIVSIPMTPSRLAMFRAYIVASAFINLVFAYVQRYILNLHLHVGLEDNIKGVFIGQGAGHVVGGSVSLSFGVFYLINAKRVPLWFRIVVALLTFWHIIISDTKQVILVFGISAGVWLLTKLKNITLAIQCFVVIFVLGYIFLWCVQNLPEFAAFNTWSRPEIYGPNGEATKLKFATFRIIPTYYKSFLNPWLGLGPGHTVSRLGGWMLQKYSSLLAPFGSTINPATVAVWDAVTKSWLGDQSSLFSPLFGWAGIWGDLGFLGLGSFLYIWSIVWRKLCVDDVSRFLVINVFIFGLVFSQMEEPGYMLFVASLIAIKWQEIQCQKYAHAESETHIEIRPKSLKSMLKRLLMIPGY